jgi:transposase-like protein
MRCALRFDPPTVPKRLQFRAAGSSPQPGRVSNGSKANSYTPAFKFQLELEVLRGERSAVKIGRIYGVHHTTISKWKHQFLDSGVEVFGKEERRSRGGPGKPRRTRARPAGRFFYRLRRGARRALYREVGRKHRRRKEVYRSPLAGRSEDGKIRSNPSRRSSQSTRSFSTAPRPDAYPPR